MRYCFIQKILFALLAITGLQAPIYGQFEEGRRDVTVTPIIGTAIVAGASSTVTYSPNTGEVSNSIQNVITFNLDEQSNLFPASPFTAIARLKIESWAIANPLSTTINTQYVPLTINYDTTTGSKYNSRAYFVLQGTNAAQQVRITVDTISITGQSAGWDPTNLLQLQNEMRVTRYFTFAGTLANLTPAFNNAVNNTDALKVSWIWPSVTYNNMSQLEWAWLEDEMAGFYTQNGVLNTDLLFKTNSTRVDIDYLRDTFSIPLLYPGPGKLYYRVRPALRKNAGYLITGPWSAAQNYAFSGHQPNLNWQSSTSFAENMKYKTVIQYFDGSLRSRQTVTKDNETGNTIVGETIYDLQGRPNVQILPTPTLNNAIQYFTNFNRFSGQLDSTQDPAVFFDLTPVAVQCNPAPALDTVLGNGRYYSGNNDWLAAESKSSYIPNSKGYAYTETRFLDDATERVSLLGGVGPNHQIGSGHETKYFYGKPSQQELDAVFGTEVGDASHYSKNMVQDANGQMSVSYVDMHGRTIATALAGAAPANLISIQNATDYPQASGVLTNQLITPASNIIKGNAIEASNTLLVPASTVYNFSYSLNPAIFSQFSASANQQICFDCKYDLEISIRQEDCANGVPIVKHYNNLQIVPAAQSCTGSMGFIGEGITIPTTSINFSQTLAAGSWVVRKTLTLNDSMFAIRRDSALKVFLVKTQQNFYDSVYAVLSASSGCTLPVGNTSVCDSCNARLGLYSVYKTNYLKAIGNPVGYDTTTIHAQYAQDSITCASSCGLSNRQSSLINLRNLLLADMIPFTGQYAIDSVRDPVTGIVTAISSSSEQSKYNIFTVAPVVTGKTKPFYQHPVTETGTASNYYTTDNTIDNTLLDANNNSILPSVGMQDFTNLFQYSWTNSLIFYHPEFNKLKFAESNLQSTYAWLDAVQSTETYALASSKGYLNPITSDPYFVNNYVASDKTLMQGYLNSYLPVTGGNASGTPSIWQVANGSVLCATTAGSAAQNSCLLGTNKTGLDSRITNSSDQDFVWRRFKSVYLGYRSDMIIGYINASTPVINVVNLQKEKKQVWFAKSAELANQDSASSLLKKAIAGDTSHLIDTANAYIVKNNLNPDKCVAQRPFWAAKLKQCEQLMMLLNNQVSADSAKVNTIINTILDSMVMVCHNSQTPFQPYGASTVNPNYSGVPRSFESVINNVLRNNSINTGTADSNYFCNPFSIDAPKPFGYNTPLFTNYANQIDSCNCTQFAAVQQQAALAGYTSSSMVSMNQFLRLNYGDTLSTTLWNALQNCSLLYTDTCTPASRGIVSNCVIYSPLYLSSYTAIPAFLNCGYQRPCISCAQFTSYTSEFISLYPNYNGVPYSAAAATDAETQRNALWARFLNYRTGFSMNALDYMAAMSNCLPSGTANFIGNGNDCGANTAVDSLLVDTRLNPYPLTYSARKTIVFENSFVSNDGDEFVAGLDSTLGVCVNNYGYAGTLISGLNTSYTICATFKPLNDPSVLVPTDTVPCRGAQTQAQFIAQLLFNKLKDSLSANFDSLYHAKCLAAQATESFVATYSPTEYHYTLYYYDQAGNLVKTTPPAAVKPNFSTAWLNNVATKRASAADTTSPNNELLSTQYRYNTLNQVMAQKNPDAATSLFWYDRLGRLTISQNAQQRLQNFYSYTLYDVLGRITEVGQRPQTTVMTQTISQDTTGLKTWLANNAAGTKEQITMTVYDVPYTPLSGAGANILAQQNLRNRVSFSLLFDNETQRVLYTDGTASGENSATYYSYDIHGNVDTLLQYNALAPLVAHGNQYKRMVYNYDLISGKVNSVLYQPGALTADQFYHRFFYDAENRITSVQTSRDSIYWEQEATYNYYRHGPLARSVLGQNQVQGIDYAYTIQGWLKGVNSNQTGDGVLDMGQDGNSLSGNKTVARDAFGYQLNYFNNDYQPIKVASAPSFASIPVSLPGSATGVGLFNGNIGSMLVSLPKLNATSPYLYGYNYDQLNRLVAMDAFTVTNNANNTIGLTATTDYQERVAYDPNGNIKSYLRNGAIAAGPTAMDDLTYQYERNASGLPLSNKLRYVQDQVADANYANDIDNQTSLTKAQVLAENSGSIAADNFQYDAIGNLIKDSKAGISNISWTVYGKIKTITKTDGGSIAYTYDAGGNRISKTVTSPTAVVTGTYYVRDATGNTLSVYTNGNTAVNSGHLTQAEIDIYGSSRLAVCNASLDVDNSVLLNSFTFTRGNKFFELSNHLGNVLATISDKKIPHTSNASSIDYYLPDLVTANDYYPFGMQMPGRKYSQPSSSYRYGFNGKENDIEIKGDGNEYNYGARIYDPRVGRFLSLDPLHAKHADMTPYHIATNNPINRIDVDGNDDIHFHYLTYTVYVPNGYGGNKPIGKTITWATVVKNNLPNTFAVHRENITTNQDGKGGSTYTERIIPFYPDYHDLGPRSGVTYSRYLGILRPDDDYTSLLKTLEDFPDLASRYPPEFRNPNTSITQREKNADFIFKAMRDSKARAAREQEEQKVNDLMLGIITVAASELLITELAGSAFVRVGQWMPKANYEKMLSTGRMVAEPDQAGMSFVATDGPGSWGPSAPQGYIYVEFNVAKKSLLQAGRETWFQAATAESNNLMRARVLGQGGELSPRALNISPVKFSKPTTITFEVHLPK